ncbi:MAG: ABC transporter [Bacteroidetes bacterium B1(2017)]|nr:MAG: ABC transporter [Bacteroidetes bacterium B1(2017)]
MTFTENLKIALNSINGNRLRATITALIISIGIMALVGILTAIDGIKAGINNSFSNMGANTFTIKNRGQSIKFSGGNKGPKKFKAISKSEADKFVAEFKFPSTTSLSVNASFASTVKYASIKTDPNIMVMGGDINYLNVAGYEIDQGRNFSEKEMLSASNAVLLGSEIKTKLFKTGNALGESVFIGGAKYRVVGILKSKGSSMGFGGDRIVIVPIQNAYQTFSMPNMSSVITVAVKDISTLDFGVEEATSLFRKIRRIPVRGEENFNVMKSDNIAKEMISNLSYVTIAATVIGFITLLGAAIGLMNIMLVSVSERTREIGIRKAIGATQKMIRRQFLFEAVVICQIGGIGGIIFGIIIGNIVTSLVGVGFIIPWLWMFSGITLCVIVGLVSGLYPAIKASKLDPIEALRFE